jgi:hypothetical protein
MLFNLFAPRSIAAGFVVTVFAALSTISAANPTPAPQGKWVAERSDQGQRSLSYNATVPLLGKPTRVTVSFNCDPLVSKQINGTLGFDVYVDNVAALKPFRFSDFEGPDATTNGRKLMRVAITRPGKPLYTVDLMPSGSTPAEGSFVLGTAEVSKLTKSPQRTLLQMLAEGAERFDITVTDPKNPKLKLEISVPVADKQAEFKTLISALK